MERIPVGNDIAISWALYDLNGQPHIVDTTGGKSIKLYVATCGLKNEVLDYTIQGNVLSWVFAGSEQYKPGFYELIYVETDVNGGASKITVRGAFLLVQDSNNAGTDNGAPHTVSVRSVLTYANLVGVETVDVIASEEDGGTNIVKIYLVTGDYFTIPIKNGSQGPSGISSVVASIPSGDVPGTPSVVASYDEATRVLSLAFQHLCGKMGKPGHQKFFTDAQALEDSGIDPEVGDYCLVSKDGDGTFPAYIYICTVAGEWTNSEVEYNSEVATVAVTQNTLSIGGEDKGELAGQIIDNDDWVHVVTDSEGKILEGINTEGEKHISKFDADTENVIKELVGSSEASSSVINIPLLDANFTSPVPVTITGTKGAGSAKYDFELPLSSDSFNIRFKFRITENLLNQEKNAKILELGNVYADAVAVPLSQYYTTETYNGNSVTMLWNDFKGGIKYNGRGGDTLANPLSLGNYAFYVQYTGSENSASIENDGTQFILKIGSTTIEFDYSTYDTVASLYEALKAVEDIVVDYKELEGRMCSELAIFPECQIKTTCYTSTDRFHPALIEEYVDSYQFYVPYAVDDLWHQIEVVKIGNTVYCSLDGIVRTFQYNGVSYDYSHLILGDGNTLYFKELSIDLTSPADAEWWSNGGRLVSSVNPAIIITEGHGIFDGPVAESSLSPDNLATSTDRLYYVYGRMRSMGYVPVSIHDIADYYAGNKQLPKRCFTSVFDGERWGDWLETAKRKVFSDLGVISTIAAVTGAVDDVTYNVYGGTKTITVKEAAELCLKNNFQIVSHTRDHWKTDCVRVSTLLNEFRQDIESSDNCLADGMILVYPGGAKTRAVFAALKWMGFRLGISIATAASDYSSNTKSKNKYNLHRVEIGFRTTLETIFNKIM